MKSEQLEENIIKYFEKELDHKETSELLSLIEKDSEADMVFKSYKEMYDMMDGCVTELPEHDLQLKFDGWLGTQVSAQDVKESKTVDLFSWKKLLSVAAVGLLMFTFWNNTNHSDPIKTQQNLAFTQLVNQESPTERIKLIRGNHNESQEGKDISKVLLDVLSKDESSNVRLAAVETLAQYTNHEEVRVGLIKALSIEEDGFVKLSIVNALGRNIDEQTKETFQSLVDDESQERFIKDEAYFHLIQY